MKKKILIGSMLVLTLLLLMPSIQAIQQEIVEDKTYQRLENGWKHPIINILNTLAVWRALRGLVLIVSTSNFPALFNEELEVYHPILFIRGFWLYGTGIGFAGLLQVLADILGWGDLGW